MLFARGKQIHAFPVSTETRIISFGLYGNDPKYTVGAVRNAELVNVYFPGNGRREVVLLGAMIPFTSFFPCLHHRLDREVLS